MWPTSKRMRWWSGRGSSPARNASCRLPHAEYGLAQPIRFWPPEVANCPSPAEQNRLSPCLSLIAPPLTLDGQLRDSRGHPREPSLVHVRAPREPPADEPQQNATGDHHQRGCHNEEAQAHSVSHRPPQLRPLIRDPSSARRAGTTPGFRRPAAAPPGESSGRAPSRFERADSRPSC